MSQSNLAERTASPDVGGRSSSASPHTVATRGVHKNQNVRVFCRVRPINKREREEIAAAPASLGGSDGGVIKFESDFVVSVPKPKGIQVLETPQSGSQTDRRASLMSVSSSTDDFDPTKDRGSFVFDRVFPIDSTQEMVFKAVAEPLVLEVMDGYNCTALAYGQTGSGKTHTMMGYSAEGIAEACGDIESDDEEEDAQTESVDRPLRELTPEELVDMQADIANLDTEKAKQLKALIRAATRGSSGSFGSQESDVDLSTMDLALRHLVRRFLRAAAAQGPSMVRPVGSAAPASSRWQKEEEQGLVPRMVKAIFEKIRNATEAASAAAQASARASAAAAAVEDPEAKAQQAPASTPSVHEDGPIEYTVKISYVEIYLERVRDLLNPMLGGNLKIRENKDRGIYIEGVTEEEARSFQDVLEIMERGDLQRSVAATRMNAKSSRSHSVFMMSVQQRDRQTNARKTSKLVLVDLAGSEKVRKTGAAGLTLLQAQHTNKSLAALGNVINSLTEGRPHIPYRDSKLTRLLSDSLGGNSKTALIITCSPALQNLEETYGTLRFGVRAKRIKNKAHVNQELTAAEYKAMLAAAKKKIDRQALIIKALEKDLERALGLLAENGVSMESLSSTAAKSGELKDSVNDDDVLEEVDTWTKSRSKTESLVEASIAAELEASISVLQGQLKQATELEEQLRDQLLQSRSNVHEQQVKLNDMRTRVKELKDSLRKEQMTSLELKEQLARQDLSHQDAVVSSMSDLELERTKFEAVQKNAATKKAELERARSEATAIAKELETARSTIASLQQQLAQARQSSGTVHVSLPDSATSSPVERKPIHSRGNSAFLTPDRMRGRLKAHNRHQSDAGTSDASFQEFLTALDDAEQAGRQGQLIAMPAGGAPSGMSLTNSPVVSPGKPSVDAGDAEWDALPLQGGAADRKDGDEALREKVQDLKAQVTQWESSFELLQKKYQLMKERAATAGVDVAEIASMNDDDVLAEVAADPNVPSEHMAILNDLLAVLGTDQPRPAPSASAGDGIVAVHDPGGVMTRLTPWLADPEVLGCMLCTKTFTLFKRRHHCRACGMIFCGDCSSKKTYVFGYKDPVRVCNGCFPTLQRQANSRQPFHGSLRGPSAGAPDPREVRRQIGGAMPRLLSPASPYANKTSFTFHQEQEQEQRQRTEQQQQQKSSRFAGVSSSSMEQLLSHFSKLMGKRTSAKGQKRSQTADEAKHGQGDAKTSDQGTNGKGDTTNWEYFSLDPDSTKDENSDPSNVSSTPFGVYFALDPATHGILVMQKHSH